MRKYLLPSQRRQAGFVAGSVLQTCRVSPMIKISEKNLVLWLDKRMPVSCKRIVMEVIRNMMDKRVRVWSVCMFRSSFFSFPPFQNMAVKNLASSRRASSLSHDIPRAERPKREKRGEGSRSTLTSDWPDMTSTLFSRVIRVSFKSDKIQTRPLKFPQPPPLICYLAEKC